MEGTDPFRSGLLPGRLHKRGALEAGSWRMSRSLPDGCRGQGHSRQRERLVENHQCLNQPGILFIVWGALYGGRAETSEPRNGAGQSRQGRSSRHPRPWRPDWGIGVFPQRRMLLEIFHWHSVCLYQKLNTGLESPGLDTCFWCGKFLWKSLFYTDNSFFFF